MNCLKESIEKKWIPVVEGRYKPVGANDCACCREFILKEFKCCNGCPISKDTGETRCNGTPEPVFAGLYYTCFADELKYDLMIEIKFDLMIELKAAAQWELDYLEDLYERTK